MNTSRAIAANTLVQQAEIVYAVPGMEAAVEAAAATAAEGDVVYSADAAGDGDGDGAGDGDGDGDGIPAAVDSAPLYAVPMKKAKRGQSSAPGKVTLSDSSDGDVGV